MIDKRMSALACIDYERERQEELRESGRYEFTCASPDGLSPMEKLAVVAEEFGEVGTEFGHVAKEVLTQAGRRQARDTEGTNRALLGELIQLAAVTTAWIESLLVDGVEPPIRQGPTGQK